MRRRVEYLATARRDIVAIFDYVRAESGSAATASDFAARLRRRCVELSRLPGHMGGPRPELGVDIRSVAIGNYVVLFRYTDKTFDVVRFIEGHRDIEAQSGGDRD